MWWSRSNGGNGNVRVDVARMEVDVRDLRSGFERAEGSLGALREDFQRLRGEMTASLPRIERGLEAVHAELVWIEDVQRDCGEQVRVHDQESRALRRDLEKKADADANRHEHDRVWLALRLFFAGTLASLLALLVKSL